MYKVTKEGKHGPDGGSSLTGPAAWFVNGVAYVDDPEYVNRYRARGYDVKPVSEVPAEYRTEAGRMFGEWNSGTHLIGSPLRDAAVDPRPGDYGVPINAGKGFDPHGPDVRAPKVHEPYQPDGDA